MQGSCLFIDKGTWSLDGWLASALELPRADDVYKPVFVDMAVMHSISFGQSQGSDLIAYTHFWDPKALWNERNVDSRNLRTLPMSVSSPVCLLWTTPQKSSHRHNFSRNKQPKQY